MMFPKGHDADRRGKDRAQDFGGILTQYVVGYLQRETREGTLAHVLEPAGETRSLAVLGDATTRSSYGEYRRLLEATGHVLGGPAALSTIGAHVFDSIQSPDLSDSMTALGSVEAIYPLLPSLTTTPVVELHIDDMGPDEVLVRFRFPPGIRAVSRALCAPHGVLRQHAPDDGVPGRRHPL